MKKTFNSLEDALNDPRIQESINPMYLNKKYKVEVGDRFDRLTTMKIVYEKIPCGKNASAWICKCDCGKYKVIRELNLIHGMTTSCGCAIIDFNKSRTDNSEITKSRRRLKVIHSAMIVRCCNPRNRAYYRYGGRGIKICDEWENSFDCFFKWSLANGYDGKLSIDRIDNDKGYEPSNCRWATLIEQNRNVRSRVVAIYQGRLLSIKKLSSILDVNYFTALSSKELHEKQSITIVRKRSFDTSLIEEI